MPVLKITKVLKPYHETIKPTDSTLCCQINAAMTCWYCKAKLCNDCGRAWSGRKHFIVDMCRKRFTKEEITEANDCFRKRTANGTVKASRLGHCKICNTRRGGQVGGDRLPMSKRKK